MSGSREVVLWVSNLYDWVLDRCFAFDMVGVYGRGLEFFLWVFVASSLDYNVCLMR